MKPHFFKIKLHLAIFIPIVVLLITSLIVLALNGYSRTYNATIGLTESVLKQESKLLKQYVENQFNQTDKSLYTLAQMMQNVSVKDNKEWLAYQFEQWNDATGMPVYLLTSNRELLRSESNPIKVVEFIDAKGNSFKKYSNSDSELLATTNSKQDISARWFQLYKNLDTASFVWQQDRDYFYLAYKISDRDDGYALIGTALNKSSLTNGLQTVISEIEQAQFYILNQSNETLLKSPQAPALNEVNKDTSLFDHNILITQFLDLNHQTQWQMVLSVPSRNLVIPIERNLQGTLLQTLLALAAVTLIIFILALRAGRPIKALRDKALMLQKQRFDEIKPVSTAVAEYQALDASLESLKQQYSAINRYVPTLLIEQLNKSENCYDISGAEKQLSLMNISIPNFTRLTREFSAEEIVRYLSAYHTVAYEVISDKLGIVDHFEAENIQSYWGAPIESDRDTFNSCHAALEIKRQLDELNQGLLRDGYPAIKFHCGVYFGNAIVGNFGSTERMVYTAIGSSVEESKVLNQHNLQYGTQIIICAETYEQVKGEFFVRKLDEIYTSKHSDGTAIYELISWKIDPQADELSSYVTDYETALDFRLKGQLDDAEVIFSKLAKLNPDDEAVVYQLGMVFQMKQQAIL